MSLALRRSPVAALPLLVLAVVAGGCGGGGGGGQGGSSSIETNATQAPQRFQGGEASIERFGSEASGADRAALLSAFRGYLGALAGGDFRDVCARLSERVQTSLRQLAGHGSGGSSCTAALPKLLAPTAARTARAERAGRIEKVRVEGDTAFIVFHAPGARLYMLTMKREGGEWKATTVSASVLAPSAATLGQ